MQTISPQQILVPKKVYIGDTAELRCTFNSPEQLLKSITKNGTTELLGEEFIQSEDLLNSADFDIQSIKLSPAGVDYYQLSIIFTPWKTGSIQFSPLTITGSQAEETGMPDQSVIISFQPLQIVSLITSESTAANSLRGIQNPLLLPGTTYKLYSAIAIFLVVLIISIRLIVKHESIAFFISSQKLKYKYKKNRKRTIKQLKKIIHSSETAKDSEKAEKIQHILREYLEVRFDYPFTKATSSEIMPGFYKTTGGLLSSEKEEAFGELAASFIRTDYIRYKKSAKFKPDELKNLIEKYITIIALLEKEEKKEAEKNV